MSYFVDNYELAPLLPIDCQSKRNTTIKQLNLFTSSLVLVLVLCDYHTKSLLALKILYIIVLKNGKLTFFSLYPQDKKKDKMSVEDIGGPLTIGGGTGIGKTCTRTQQ